jgi:hypothetical protein
MIKSVMIFSIIFLSQIHAYKAPLTYTQEQEEGMIYGVRPPLFHGTVSPSYELREIKSYSASHYPRKAEIAERKTYSSDLSEGRTNDPYTHSVYVKSLILPGIFIFEDVPEIATAKLRPIKHLLQ